jgi:hypothetical protein
MFASRVSLELSLMPSLLKEVARVKLSSLQDSISGPLDATMPSLSISRERSPLAILLDPKKDIAVSERDIRLEDYLNDKIQTAADFDSLASLIANVEIQKKQLEEQVSDHTLSYT